MAKTPLQKAFKKINELNLPITIDQRLELNQILCDLATVSYNNGSDTATKIFKKYT